MSYCKNILTANKYLQNAFIYMALEKYTLRTQKSWMAWRVIVDDANFTSWKQPELYQLYFNGVCELFEFKKVMIQRADVVRTFDITRSVVSRV